MSFLAIHRSSSHYAALSYIAASMHHVRVLTLNVTKDLLSNIHSVLFLVWRVLKMDVTLQFAAALCLCLSNQPAIIFHLQPIAISKFPYRCIENNAGYHFISLYLLAAGSWEWLVFVCLFADFDVWLLCERNTGPPQVVITLFWRPYWKGQCKWSSAPCGKWMGRGVEAPYSEGRGDVVRI